MIRPLTKDEFINIATNGIKINLYDNFVEDYIENLIRFIEEPAHEYYVSDFSNEWCDIAKHGDAVLKVRFEKEKIKFYLKEEAKDPDVKKAAGIAIKIVYMHSIAWEAINNDGQFNQRIEPWPV